MSKQKKISLVAKLDFVDWFRKQPPSTQYKLATTPYDSDSQVGKGRRLMFRALDLMNKRHKS